jgi:hypothetical protein
LQIQMKLEGLLQMNIYIGVIDVVIWRQMVVFFTKKFNLN